MEHCLCEIVEEVGLISCSISVTFDGAVPLCECCGSGIDFMQHVSDI